MKFCLFAGLILASMAQASIVQAQTPRFQVQGRQILDPSGQTFVPNGVNIGFWTDNTRDDDVEAIKNQWMFNAVRVPLQLQNATSETEATDELLDRHVEAFTGGKTGPKLVVIFSPFDRNGEFYRDGEKPGLSDLLEFWERTATRYKSNPYVWFNIQNAPGGATETPREWFDLHRRAIQTIRATGAANPIVCDGHNFGSEQLHSQTFFTVEKNSAALLYGRQLLELDPAKNLVFGFQPGAPWNFSRDKMTDFVARVQAKNLALMATGYGATSEISGGYDTTQAALWLTQLSRERKIGKVLWHYWDGDGNALTTARWGSSTGRDLRFEENATRPSNLTWLGELVWDDLHDTPVAPMGAPLNRFAWRAKASIGQNHADKAIDSDFTSTWSVNYRTVFLAPAVEKADWIQIDLGAPVSFDGLLLETRRSATHFPRDLKIYASNNPQKMGAPIHEIEDNAHSTVRARFSPQTARFVRVSASRFGRDWGKNRDALPRPKFISWSVADLQLFNSQSFPLGKIGRTPISRAQWSARASARPDWQRNWEGAALDNDKTTRYHSGRPLQIGDEFVIDMKAVRTVATVRLDSGLSPEAHARKFQIFASRDGKSWGAPLISDLGGPVTFATFSGPVNARFLKIVNAQPTRTPWILHDVQVFAP